MDNDCSSSPKDAATLESENDPDPVPESEPKAGLPAQERHEKKQDGHETAPPYTNSAPKPSVAGPEEAYPSYPYAADYIPVPDQPEFSTIIPRARVVSPRPVSPAPIAPTPASPRFKIPRALRRLGRPFQFVYEEWGSFRVWREARKVQLAYPDKDKALFENCLRVEQGIQDPSSPNFPKWRAKYVIEIRDFDHRLEKVHNGPFPYVPGVWIYQREPGVWFSQNGNWVWQSKGFPMVKPTNPNLAPAFSHAKRGPEWL